MAIPGTSAHNPYPTDYHCAAYRAAVAESPQPDRPLPALGLDRRGAVRPGRLGWRPDHRFGFDGLRSALTQALSAGASGIGIWGSDIGGFFALGANA